jgi:hypothetical protein
MKTQMRLGLAMASALDLTWVNLYAATSFIIAYLY